MTSSRSSAARRGVVAACTALAAVAFAARAEAVSGPDPDKLTILFATGSASVDDAGVSTLDHASRLYRAGHPIVMIVSGSTDRTGNADQNLLLSERRAQHVLDGLTDRGIPVERLQLLAKGETDASGSASVPDAADRKVEITWR